MPVLVGFLDNVNGGAKFGYQQNERSLGAKKLDTEEAGRGRKIECGRHWVWFWRWTHLLERLGKMKETWEKGKRAGRGERN